MRVWPELVETWVGFRHQFRVVWRSSRLFAVAAAVGALLFSVLAAVVAYAQSVNPLPVPVDVVGLLGAVWFSLLILPAIGGGGDDDVSALASVPSGRSFRLGVHLASTGTDVASGVLIPSLGLLGAFVGSYSGWVAGLVLGVVGLFAGQVSGAAATRLMSVAGSTLSLLAITGLAAVLVRYASSAGPGLWFELLRQYPVLYLVVPVVLVGLWALARALTDIRPVAYRRARTHGFSTVPVLALVQAGLFGVFRSLVVRNSLLTVVLVPLFARAVGVDPGPALALVLTASAAVLVGANGFAFDAGGASWVVGRVGFSRVLLLRWLVGLCWVGLVAVVSLLVLVLVGVPVSAQFVAVLGLVVLAGSVAGLVPSVKRPVSVDLDLSRAQPAPPVSAVGVMFRVMLLAGVAGFAPLWLAALVVLGYVVLAFWHAGRLGRDPVALAALS